MTYGLFALIGLPSQFFYGVVGGIGVWPHHAQPMLFGALLGRYYLAKRFGKDKWKRYAPILLAGYGKSGRPRFAGNAARTR